MPNEIYHRSEWGKPKVEGFGDVYFDASATNKLYKHSDNYENSDATDNILRDIPNKASIVLTPTAYSDGSLNTVIPTDGNGDFDFSRGSSATRVNEKGLIEDVASNIPRIDYTDGTGALLLEPQSTNLVTYSEDFSQWNLGAGTTVEFGYLSPDGTNNAYKVSGSGGALNLAGIANETQTRTIYARTVSGTGNAHLCSYFGNTNNLFTITEQWQRFEVNGTTTSTGATSFYAVDFRGSTDLTELIIWGAQLEQKSFATSYIPTEGATVTRSADVANNSGNADLFNDSEGVLYAEILKKQDDNDTYILISLNNDASNADTNSVTLGFDADDDFYFRVKSNGSDVLKSIGITANKNQFYKVAVKYKSGDCAVWIDGVEQVTSTTAFTFGQTLDNLSFDFNGNGSLAFYGNVKSLAVFKEALTDEELQALTT